MAQETEDLALVHGHVEVVHSHLRTHRRIKHLVEPLDFHRTILVAELLQVDRDFLNVLRVQPSRSHLSSVLTSHPWIQPFREDAESSLRANTQK